MALTIYLAGAIEACSTFEETHGWRAEAEEQLTALGHNVICPLCHGEASLFGKELDMAQVDKIVEKDLGFVEESDVVLVNGSIRSEGTAMEIYHANMCGVTVITYGLRNDLRTFVRYFSDMIVPDLRDAIAEIQVILECSHAS